MKPWHGIDLDGTLARYEGWEGPHIIGPPVPLMVDRIEKWLALGEDCRIVTARCGLGPKEIRFVKAWLKEVGLPPLIITDRKDFNMIDLWDDQVVRVQRNTGIPLNRW